MKLALTKSHIFSKNIRKLRRLSRLRSSLSCFPAFAFSSEKKNYSDYRKWLYANEDYTRGNSDLRIMSYNILADSYAYEYLFPACPMEDKNFDFRSKLLKRF